MGIPYHIPALGTLPMIVSADISIPPNQRWSGGPFLSFLVFGGMPAPHIERLHIAGNPNLASYAMRSALPPSRRSMNSVWSRLSAALCCMRSIISGCSMMGSTFLTWSCIGPRPNISASASRRKAVLPFSERSHSTLRDQAIDVPCTQAGTGHQ